MTAIQQATVVVAQQDPTQALGQLALFMPDGTSVDLSNLGSGGDPGLGNQEDGYTNWLTKVYGIDRQTDPELGQMYKEDNLFVVADAPWPWSGNEFFYPHYTNGAVAKSDSQFTVDTDNFTDNTNLVTLLGLPADTEVTVDGYGYNAYQSNGEILDTFVAGTPSGGILEMDISSWDDAFTASDCPRGRLAVKQDGEIIGIIYIGKMASGTLQWFMFGMEGDTFTWHIWGLSDYISESDEGFVMRVENGIWNAVKPNLSGGTSSRPSGHLCLDGTPYFDTTLGYPIWWNGSEWVDSTGEEV